MVEYKKISNRSFHYSSGSQSVAPKPEAAASENLLEMQSSAPPLSYLFRYWGHGCSNLFQQALQVILMHSLKCEDHCTGEVLLVLGSGRREVYLTGQSGKEWLSPFSVSAIKSAVCNKGAFWSVPLAGCKPSGPEFSVGKACGFPVLLVTRWVSNPEMEWEKGFAHKSKVSPSKKSWLEDSILIGVYLSPVSYFLIGSELRWGRRGFYNGAT